MPRNTRSPGTHPGSLSFGLLVFWACLSDFRSFLWNVGCGCSFGQCGWRSPWRTQPQPPTSGHAPPHFFAALPVLREHCTDGESRHTTRRCRMARPRPENPVPQRAGFFAARPVAQCRLIASSISGAAARSRGWTGQASIRRRGSGGSSRPASRSQALEFRACGPPRQRTR